MKRAIHTFAAGVQPDVHPLQIVSTALTYAQNVELLKGSGDEFVLRGQDGTEACLELPDGYVPVGGAFYGGVYYFALAEVVNGVASGRGEIGTYPSPDYRYAAGTLLARYRALANFSGNFLPEDLQSRFNSPSFGFSLLNAVQMLLQPDYDGTINILLNDSKESPRLINSGFRAETNGTFRIINRSGEKDSNQYNEASFATKIPLLLSASKLPQVKVTGVLEGGTLLPGAYQYFLRYASTEGDETDVVAETLTVMVSPGRTPATTDGGNAERSSGKAVELTITGVDTSFAFLQVYFVRTQSERSGSGLAHKFTSRLPATGEILSFTHTGYEQSQPLPVERLQVPRLSISSIRSFVQLDNRLFLAGYQEEVRDFDILKNYARTCLPMATVLQLSSPGLANERNQSDLLSAFSSNARLLDGYMGGYYNALNEQQYSGYMGGETYPFAIRFTFLDGSVSPPFPVLGMDNAAGNLTVQNGQLRLNGNPLFINYNALDAEVNEGMFTTAPGLNTRGLYRFPTRKVSGFGPLLGKTVDGTPYLRVLGMKLYLPPIPIAIREQTIGLEILRGERIADCLLQGYLTDTIPVPNLNFLETNAGDYRLNSHLYTRENAKSIPAPAFLLEASAYAEEGNNGVRSNNNVPSITPFRFADYLFGKTAALAQLPWGKRLALFCPELYTDRDGVIGNMQSKNLFIDPLSDVNFAYAAPASSYIHNNTNPNPTTRDGDYFSLLQTIEQTSPSTLAPREANFDFVLGQSQAKSPLGFSGAASFQAKSSNSIEGYGVFLPSFNDYIGVELTSGTYTIARLLKENDIDPAGKKVDEDGIFLTEKLTNAMRIRAASLVNIYPQSGLRSLDIVKKLYPLSSLRYSPMSALLTYAQVESQLDSARTLILCGGDCLVTPSYHRLYVGQADNTEDEKFSKVHVGYTLSLITETTGNPARRSPEQGDLSEISKRSFLPRLLTSTTAGDLMGNGNSWRESRLPDTSSYLPGYRYRQSYRPALPEAQVPFSERNFDTAVLYSDIHVPGSYENGYRRIFPSARQLYDRQAGPITALMNLSGNLLMIQPKAISRLAVNERIQTGSDSGGAIFVEAAGVLSPKAGVISAQIGSAWADSLLCTDNYLYGVDMQQAQPLCFRTNGQNVELLSDNLWGGFLQRFLGNSFAGGRHHLSCNIRTFYAHKKVYFSFYYLPNGETLPEGIIQETFEGNVARCLTLVYHETLNQWQGLIGLHPLLTLLGDKELMGFSLHAPTIGYRHNVRSIDNLLYGRAFVSVVQFSMNAETNVAKVLDNLKLTASTHLPILMHYESENQTVEETLRQGQGILYDNARYKEGHLYVQVGRMGRQRVRGKYVRVTIIYRGSDPFYLQAVETLYRHSAN